MEQAMEQPMEQPIEQSKGDNVNVSTPDKKQLVALEWMINDPTGGFHEKNLSSKGGSPQYVSISKNDANKEPLKGLPSYILTSATIDRQGVINVPIGPPKKKVEVPFVNVQAQIGKKPDRHTYSHVNVVADRDVGVDLMKKALNESLAQHDSRWIVETAPGKYQIQANRPT